MSDYSINFSYALLHAPRPVQIFVFRYLRDVKRGNFVSHTPAGCRRFQGYLAYLPTDDGKKHYLEDLQVDCSAPDEESALETIEKAIDEVFKSYCLFLCYKKGIIPRQKVLLEAAADDTCQLLKREALKILEATWAVNNS